MSSDDSTMELDDGLPSGRCMHSRCDPCNKDDDDDDDELCSLGTLSHALQRSSCRWDQRVTPQNSKSIICSTKSDAAESSIAEASISSFPPNKSNHTSPNKSQEDENTLDIVENGQSSHQGEAWRCLEQLQQKKLCHHCTINTWHHPLIPVCQKCLPRLNRVACRHCSEEFLQHKILSKAERYFGRTICLACARNLSHCELCNQWAAFGEKRRCDRCIQMIEKYGPPETCVRCSNNAAFKRESEKMKKVDDLLLCFKCTAGYKKEKYKSDRQRRRNDKSHDGPQEEKNHRSVEHVILLKKEIEKQKGIVETLKGQLSGLHQQLKKKETEILCFAQKIEQENLLVRREAEESFRKAARDELQVKRLMIELSDADRSRNEEVKRLISSNQEEREKLNEVIEKLKISNEDLTKSYETTVATLKEMKIATREKEKEFQKYKALTEQRVIKISQKFHKAMEKQEEKFKQRNREITDLKKQVALLEAAKEKMFLIEQHVLGFEEENELVEQYGND